MIATTQTIPNIQVTDGTLTIKFIAIEGETLLCCIETIREGLKIGDVPDVARVPGKNNNQQSGCHVFKVSHH